MSGIHTAIVVDIRDNFKSNQLVINIVLENSRIVDETHV